MLVHTSCFRCILHISVMQHARTFCSDAVGGSTVRKLFVVLQGFANEVFDAAYNITTDADSALGIFDDLVVILNVDVNVSGMNSDVTVSCFHFAVKMFVTVASATTHIHNIGQCSTTCHGMTLHGTEHGTAQPGTAKHSTAWHSTAWHSIAWHSTAWHSTAWHTFTIWPKAHSATIFLHTVNGVLGQNQRCRCKTIKLILIMLQCVGTWLNGMVDPTVIADGLESLDTYLSGTSSTSGVFDPAREAVITDLASYGVCAQCFCKWDCLCCDIFTAFRQVQRSAVICSLLHYSCMLIH